MKINELIRLLVALPDEQKEWEAEILFDSGYGSAELEKVDVATEKQIVYLFGDN